MSKREEDKPFIPESSLKIEDCIDFCQKEIKNIESNSRFLNIIKTLLYQAIALN